MPTGARKPKRGPRPSDRERPRRNGKGPRRPSARRRPRPSGRGWRRPSAREPNVRLPIPSADEAAQEAKRAQETARQDRLAVQNLIQRYKASVEARDFEALKATWPTAPEKQLRQGFQFARSWRVDLQPTDIQITGDAAVVVCQRRDEMVTTDGTKIPARSSTPRFSLRKRGGSWIIEGIQ